MGEREPPTASSILVVDDDASVLAMLRAVLESEGHTVTTARSATDAIDKLQSGSFDMVITDMRMETETAGFDVVRAARLKPEAPAIVILTAYPMLEQQWREAGAAAGLMKGMPVAQFTAVIDQLLAARAQHQ
jgi:CheY-like chemotaxis protein